MAARAIARLDCECGHPKRRPRSALELSTQSERHGRSLDLRVVYRPTDVDDGIPGCGEQHRHKLRNRASDGAFPGCRIPVVR